MPSTREIRRRIKSVTNIGQITKAMELVAASRMRRAQEQALSGRRYTSTMDFMLGSLLAQTDPGRHPLLGIKADASTDEGRSTLVLAIGPDKKKMALKLALWVIVSLICLEIAYTFISSGIWILRSIISG